MIRDDQREDVGLVGYLRRPTSSKMLLATIYSNLFARIPHYPPKCLLEVIYWPAWPREKLPAVLGWLVGTRRALTKMPLWSCLASPSCSPTLKDQAPSPICGSCKPAARS